MQIDFHHGLTYALARIAGFGRAEAQIVATANQYVDDATNDGLVRFQNGALYLRMATAHRMLDYRNFEALANHRVWLPFHFLPGNAGKAAGAPVEGPFVLRLVCTPNSPVAQDMIAATIQARAEPYALHRLGIALHIYMDTWAHQGFAGVSHEVNQVSEVRGPDGALDESLPRRLANYFMGEALPLGHGPALSYPDRPWMVWSYTNGLGHRVERDNPAIYLDAAHHLLMAMRRYLAGDPQAVVEGLSERDADAVRALIAQCCDTDPVARHGSWMSALADGTFSFGRDEGVTYVAKGEGSWKHAALGTLREKDVEGEVHPFRPDFFTSDWKRFHDAAQVHRLHLLTSIFPRYGICAA